MAILNHFPAQISGSVTCLEAMRAQSPPKNDALDAQYHAWQVKESCPQVAQDWQISAQLFHPRRVNSLFFLEVSSGFGMLTPGYCGRHSQSPLSLHECRTDVTKHTTHPRKRKNSRKWYLHRHHTVTRCSFTSITPLHPSFITPSRLTFCPGALRGMNRLQCHV